MSSKETSRAREPASHWPQARCRFCAAPLESVFVDLGMSPLCQTHVTPEQLDSVEPFYPLRVHVCGECFLVQLREYVAPDAIFSEYAYFSSFSTSWLDHARRYADAMVDRFGLGRDSQVVELASNDGYLLQYFAARGIRVLGVEPAANVAAAAVDKGIPTVVRFFGKATAAALVQEGRRADLIAANNVLAHVPDINDFVAGIRTLLKDDGVATLEFPHLVRLVDECQFDTIYHEHYSYLSFTVVERIFAAHGLRVFDVESLPTHGGSLRVFACPREASRPTGPRVGDLRREESALGLGTLAYYTGFGEKVARLKQDLLLTLIGIRRAGGTIAGYGAPGKGNTLLNYCGIRTDLLDFTVDRNPYKQGKYTPGTRIPILDPEQIRARKPDHVLILPWNLKHEIMDQLAYIREWGGRFIVPIPEVRVH